MRYRINFITFLLLICLVSCIEYNKESKIMHYFKKMGWHYPFHVLKGSLLRFSNNFYEDGPVKYDTLRLIKLKDAFAKQAIEYFKKELPVDTTVGYVIEKPIIYKNLDDSLVYSIGIKKFKFNNKGTIMPCEGCEAIENNTIFVSGNRAIFTIKTKSILKFKNWMD